MFYTIISLMRDAAIMRHQILHTFFRDDWQPHEEMIKTVYGW